MARLHRNRKLGCIGESNLILQENILKFTRLSKHCNNHSLGAYFSYFGDIIKAVVSCDFLGISKKFGYVIFVKKESVDEVLNSSRFKHGINVTKAIVHGTK